MKLIVGLGNPGDRYRPHRHNVGFRVLDQLAAVNHADAWKSRFDSLAADVAIGGVKTLLLKPQQYMNRSGGPTRRAMDFYKLTADDVLVICDDFNLPTGRLRIRGKGSAGGQNGLKDILLNLGTDGVARLRVGIGPPGAKVDPADYVLSEFSPSERPMIEDAIIAAGQAAECWVTAGLDIAMTRFNRKDTQD